MSRLVSRGAALKAWLLAVLLVGGGLFSPAVAESVRNIINDQTSVLERFTPPPTRPPRLGVTIDDTIAGVPAGRLEGVRFVFRGVEFEGAETLDPALFAPLYSNLIGREITLAGIKPLLDGIERVYRENDYYALALVPPQDVAAGVIRVVVYESYIREVSIEGDDIAGIRNLQPRLQPYIDRMVEMRPVRISRLLRYALLMTDLAGLTINAEFSQILDEPGAGRLVLKIDFDPSSFRARLDNFSSNSVGPLELAGNVRFNNAFGLFEWTDILLVTNPEAPEELVFGRFAQHVPLGPSGFAMGYEYSHVWSNPDEDDDIHAETSQARIYLDYAVIRSQERNLIATLSLSGKDIAVDVNGDPVVRQDKRWASLGATYDDTILGVDAIIDVAFANGIDGLGATGESNANDFRFATLEGSLSRSVTETLSTKLLYTGQYAFTDLPNAVNFSLGGETYGRAFDNSALSGDSGYALAFEANQQLNLGIDWLSAFSVFGFVDYGAVWNPPDRGGYEFASVGSVGGGIRAAVGRHTMVSTWVAVPYKDEPKLGAEGTQVRFIAGLQF